MDGSATQTLERPRVPRAGLIAVSAEALPAGRGNPGALGGAPAGTRARAPAGPAPAPGESSPERELVDALRSGDERAFAAMVEAHHATMVRFAMMYVPSRAVAEEVVQETWLAVLQGLDRFEARSSLKTWIFRILMNRAVSRGQRERRVLPLSALGEAEMEAREPSVDPGRFRPAGADLVGHWLHPPSPWKDPEEQLLSDETISIVAETIETLPPNQRQVIVLRDMRGWSSQEVCEALGITDTNQRVLLHRARTKVRRRLERYFDDRV